MDWNTSKRFVLGMALIALELFRALLGETTTAALMAITTYNMAVKRYYIKADRIVQSYNVLPQSCGKLRFKLEM